LRIQLRRSGNLKNSQAESGSPGRGPSCHGVAATATHDGFWYLVTLPDIEIDPGDVTRADEEVGSI